MNNAVAFHTLGCKLNFAETSTIARQLRQHGYRRVEFSEAADVYIINTCSVTENADRECRTIVRRALHLNPDAFVAVIGCYAQLKPGEIAGIEGVDLVLGATEKFNIINYLQDLRKKEFTEIHSCEISSVDFYSGSYSVGDRTRAFLKVQDGCDYSCTYCTIPLARGISRSDTIEQVVHQAMEIAGQGVKEIVLTGVNIGDFKDPVAPSQRASFLVLLEELDKVKGIERFRISSIEPNLLTDEIIEFVSSSEKFVPHFHIPLQSGSDKILRLMKRRYRRSLYSDRVAKIKSLMPQACIGADVITGFPGETNDDFAETYNFLNALGVSYLHVFTYSERDHTEAAAMPGVVPVQERKRRNKMLRILSQKKLTSFYSQHLGETAGVLFESEAKDGLLHGFTGNYIRVIVPFDKLLVNKIQEVFLKEISSEGTVSGELLTKNKMLPEPAISF